MIGQSLENSAMAKGMMTIAQKRLIQNYPFHARLVSMCRVDEMCGLPTAGVTILNGAIHFVYNPEFIVICTMSQIQGVLLHEINHVLFEHILADPAQFPDRRARIIAEETTVNEWVADPLPGTPITLAQFPELPANEDTNTRYARLARKTDSTDPESGGSEPKTTGSVRKNASPTQKTGSFGPDTVQTLDDHDLWEEARQQEALSKLIIKVTVAAACEAMTAEEWQKVPAELRRQIDRLSQGIEQGSFAESLMQATTGTIAWRQALRRYVHQAVNVKPAFHRPPRRFPHLVGIVPGTIHRPSKARVMAVIDTSGSIGTVTLEQISAELALMNRDHEVMVVECDAAIHAIYPFTHTLTTVHGRGGTDLRPPFQATILGKLKPDVTVYFTDGAGPAPTNQPRVPVIWCLTQNGRRPVPWGRTIQMHGD